MSSDEEGYLLEKRRHKVDSYCVPGGLMNRVILKRKRSSNASEAYIEDFIDSSLVQYTVHVDGHLSSKAGKKLTSFTLQMESPFCLEDLGRNRFNLFIKTNLNEGLVQVKRDKKNFGLLCTLEKKDYFYYESLKTSAVLFSMGSEQLITLSPSAVRGISVQIDILLTKSLIFDCYLNDQPINDQKRPVMNLMSLIYNYPSIEAIKGRFEPPLTHIETIFDEVAQYHRQETLFEMTQPEDLRPTLRNYQMKALKWMLKREQWPGLPEDLVRREDHEPHPLWVYCEPLDLQYNYRAGYFRLNDNQKLILGPRAKGGILADEMGLGKTVEILALILSNPSPLIELEMSAVKPVEYKSKFMCRCGLGSSSSSRQSKCIRCGYSQHNRCMQYNADEWSHLPYYCPGCWVESDVPKLKSKATIIITPSSIHHQWRQEILKHITRRSFKVLLYEGVSKTYYYPYELASSDIVLTSYETLRSELRFVDLPREDRLRRPKRFKQPATPLLALEWWRVVLDEAQMVESASSQAAQMAGNLISINNWCVTGTPIQKSVNDLHGLVLFAGERPYCNRLWWKLLISDPYYNADMRPLTDLLKDCFWRNSKKDVSSELGLPERTEHVIKMDFTSIEQHFYQRQREKCLRIFDESIRTIDDLNISLKHVDRTTAIKLMNPLLKLRQACCHPQIVGNQILSMSKKTMTMEEVLKTMIKRTSLECEEDHRKVIAALNGQAGLHVIDKNLAQAVHVYRNALTSIESYKGKFRTDKLQYFHTLYNLADVLKMIKSVRNSDGPNDFSDEAKVESVGFTLRDDQLEDEAEGIRSAYLIKGISQVEEARNQLDSVMANTKEQVAVLKSDWWVKALNSILRNTDVNSFLAKVIEGLQERALINLVKQGKIYSYLQEEERSIPGLQFMIVNGVDELEDARKDLIKAVTQLKSQPDDKSFNEAIECHLRPSRNEEGLIVRGKLCTYCSIHEMFKRYEKSLFFSVEEKKRGEKKEDEFERDELEKEMGNFEFVDPKVNFLDEQRKGNWSESEIEQFFKTVYVLISRQSGLEKVQSSGKKMLELLDSLKKEFRALRVVWMGIFDYVSRLDELNMATLRMRLRYPDEPEPDATVKYILQPYEVENTRVQLISDEKISKADLRKHLMQLNFLMNLEKSNTDRQQESNPDPCPICINPFGSQWSALPCGHSYCFACCNDLITDYLSVHRNKEVFRCAICREVCKPTEILHVDLSQKKDQETIKIHGSWSTKVEEIIRTLIQIRTKESSAKCLVFSTWVSFLVLLSRALQQNEIKFILADKPKKLASQIDIFKRSDAFVILMPIHLGSKGLNITEASHALLVEPLLDPSHEYQAIGRIHRIGQTKPTHVYKFIMSRTIEEKISSMFSISADYNELTGEGKQICETVQDICDILFVSDESDEMNAD